MSQFLGNLPAFIANNKPQDTSTNRLAILLNLISQREDRATRKLLTREEIQAKLAEGAANRASSESIANKQLSSQELRALAEIQARIQEGGLDRANRIDVANIAADSSRQSDLARILGSGLEGGADPATTAALAKIFDPTFDTSILGNAGTITPETQYEPLPGFDPSKPSSVKTYLEAAQSKRRQLEKELEGATGKKRERILRELQVAQQSENKGLSVLQNINSEARADARAQQSADIQSAKERSKQLDTFLLDPEVRSVPEKYFAASNFAAGIPTQSLTRSQRDALGEAKTSIKRLTRDRIYDFSFSGASFSEKLNEFSNLVNEVDKLGINKDEVRQPLAKINGKLLSDLKPGTFSAAVKPNSEEFSRVLSNIEQYNSSGITKNPIVPVFRKGIYGEYYYNGYQPLGDINPAVFDLLRSGDVPDLLVNDKPTYTTY